MERKKVAPGGGEEENEEYALLKAAERPHKGGRIRRWRCGGGKITFLSSPPLFLLDSTGYFQNGIGFDFEFFECVGEVAIHRDARRLKTKERIRNE